MGGESLSPPARESPSLREAARLGKPAEGLRSAEPPSPGAAGARDSRRRRRRLPRPLRPPGVSDRRRLFSLPRAREREEKKKKKRQALAWGVSKKHKNR